MIGASIAFHLAEAGVEDVLLVERAELALGLDAKGAGGVRAMFSDELNVRIALRSLEAWGAFGERPGWEIDLRRVGYLFLLSSDEEVAEFERSVEMQNRLGVPSRMAVARARRASARRSPGWTACSRRRSARWRATRRPEAVGPGLRRRRAGHGARIAAGARGDRDRAAGGRVTGVRRRRRGRDRHAWSARPARGRAQVGALAGVELPVTPERRRIAYTGRCRSAAGAADDDRLRDRLLLPPRGPRPAVRHRTTSCDDPATSGSSAPCRCCAARPVLLDAPIAGGWWGDYEMTPDHNALIGERRGGPGRFLYATGFSGHGFLQAPGVGEIVRDLYLGREPFVDVSALAAGRPERRERNVV